MIEQINRIFTGGNVEVQNIKIGDIHYEYGYDTGIKVEVITLPEKSIQKDDSILWQWVSKTDNGQLINYAVNEKYSHFYYLPVFFKRIHELQIYKKIAERYK